MGLFHDGLLLCSTAGGFLLFQSRDVPLQIAGCGHGLMLLCPLYVVWIHDSVCVSVGVCTSSVERRFVKALNNNNFYPSSFWRVPAKVKVISSYHKTPTDIHTSTTTSLIDNARTTGTNKSNKQYHYTKLLTYKTKLPTKTAKMVADMSYSTVSQVIESWEKIRREPNYEEKTGKKLFQK